MIYKKGFSLIEVLISLILVTTLGLALLAQQGQAKQLLTQLALHAKASQYLNRADESLLVGIAKIPRAPSPYIFVVNENQKSIILRLSWFKNLGSLIRKYPAIGFT